MNTEQVTTSWARANPWWRRIGKNRFSRGERTLIAAQGQALAMLVTTLEVRGHLDARRFAETLALLGAVVNEEDELEGAIFASWANMMYENIELRNDASA